MTGQPKISATVEQHIADLSGIHIDTVGIDINTLQAASSRKRKTIKAIASRTYIDKVRLTKGGIIKNGIIRCCCTKIYICHAHLTIAIAHQTMQAQEVQFAVVFHNTLRVTHFRLETGQLLALTHHNHVIVASLPNSSLAVLIETIEKTLTKISIKEYQFILITHGIDTISSSTNNDCSVLSLKKTGNTRMDTVRERIMDKGLC